MDIVKEITTKIEASNKASLERFRLEQKELLAKMDRQIEQNSKKLSEQEKEDLIAEGYRRAMEAFGPKQ